MKLLEKFLIYNSNCIHFYYKYGDANFVLFLLNIFCIQVHTVFKHYTSKLFI